ncbi:MAG: CHASE2 domain-containing protein, partial [Pseudomonadota bacterium]|nr:CHASE2 domain-containing protein [Pseudomonadota bacterium]
MLIRIADLFTRRAWAIILALAVIAGVTAAVWGWATPIEHRLEGARHSLFSKPPSGETVIVEIDARSLAEVQAWPWPRSVHGRLVDRLRQAGARQVVFDIDFTSPAADPDQDRAFAAALARAPGLVVLPGLLENVDGHFGTRTEALPSEPLRPHVRIGTIWIRLDEDMLARRLPHSAQIAGEQRPSLAAVLADRPSDRRDDIILDWSIDPAAFPRISYSDVLAGRFDPAFFRGRNVLVGGTSSTMGDRFVAPTHDYI